MAGDVNIFLHEPEEEGNAADLECEVMIAGPLRYASRIGGRTLTISAPLARA